MKICRNIILLCAALFCLAPSAPQSLRYRWDADQALRYRLDYQSKGTFTRQTDAEASPLPVKVDVRSLINIEPKPARTSIWRMLFPARSFYELAMRLEGLSLSWTQGAENNHLVVGPDVLRVNRNDKPLLALDADDAASIALKKEYQKLLEPVQLIQDDLGEIHRLEGFEQFDLLAPQLALKEVITKNMVKLPESPLSSGDQWRDSLQLQLPHCSADKCRMQLSYKVIGQRKIMGINCLRLKIDGKADLTDQDFVQDAASDVISGSDTRYTYFYQKLSGEVDFAVSEGIVVRSKLKIDTSYHAVFAYAESGINTTEDPVDLELTSESNFTLIGEKETNRIMDWLRSLFP